MHYLQAAGFASGTFMCCKFRFINCSLVLVATRAAVAPSTATMVCRSSSSFGDDGSVCLCFGLSVPLGIVAGDVCLLLGADDLRSLSGAGDVRLLSGAGDVRSLSGCTLSLGAIGVTCSSSVLVCVARVTICRLGRTEFCGFSCVTGDQGSH